LGANGAGLGLAIVKSIATLHGGSCSIESELSKGTSVTLILP
jgi:signal transduction histidine kinase